MVFSSASFLFFFLPAALALYHVAPRRARNGVLLAFSLVFYAWGAGTFTLVLVASIAANFVVGLKVEQATDAGLAGRARAWLAAGVALNVGLLGYFKYANLAVATWDAALASAGIPAVPWAPVLLPIGISFYTFHAISYLVDIYRGTARHLVQPVDFGLYILFFPQLIAGPIVRFHEIRDQLVERRETWAAFSAGLYRFSLGLGKKVLIADSVAPIVNAVFGMPADQLNVASALLGLVAYTVQLYFDFSGYSDMALGLGLMVGIRLPENFDRPYAARSITEFWRRWHMSLSRWFRDYLYIPLGGNRGSTARTYRNLIIVFLVTGLWHGANLTFVVWGAYHGVLLILERVAGVGRSAAPRRALPWQPITIVLVMAGWVVFRSPTVAYAIEYFGAFGRLHRSIPIGVSQAADPIALIALVIGCASVLLPGWFVAGRVIERADGIPGRVLRLAAIGVLLPASIVLISASGFSPFLYFQF